MVYVYFPCRIETNLGKSAIIIYLNEWLIIHKVTANSQLKHSNTDFSVCTGYDWLGELIYNNLNVMPNIK